MEWLFSNGETIPPVPLLYQQCEINTLWKYNRIKISNTLKYYHQILLRGKVVFNRQHTGWSRKLFQDESVRSCKYSGVHLSEFTMQYVLFIHNIYFNDIKNTELLKAYWQKKKSCNKTHASVPYLFYTFLLHYPQCNWPLQMCT